MQTIIALIGIKILKQLAVKFPRKSPSGSHKNTCLLVDLCTTTSKMEAFCRTLFPSVMHEILMAKIQQNWIGSFPANQSAPRTASQAKCSAMKNKT